MPPDAHDYGGRGNVQVFPAAVTDVVTLTPFLTFPMGLSSIFWYRRERCSNNMLTQKCGTFVTNPGRMLAQGWQLGFLQLSDS